MTFCEEFLERDSVRSCTKQRLIDPQSPRAGRPAPVRHRHGSVVSIFQMSEAVPDPVDTSPPPRLRFDVSVRSLVVVSVGLLAIWILIHVIPALLVLVTALMLVGALNPAVEWLERVGSRRGLAIMAVFTTAGVATMALLLLVLPPLAEEVRSVIERAPEFRAKAVNALSGSSWTAPLAEVLKQIDFETLFKSSRESLLRWAASLIEMLAYTVSVIFLAVYIMIDRDRLRGALFAVVPRTMHIKLSRVLLDLENIVGGYIRGQLLTSALMTVFIFAVLSLCHLPNALAIAVFGGIADMLPYIGIVLTMVPAVLAAMAKGPAVSATVFGLLFAYEEFEGRVLIPLIYGRALRLPSSVVFFSLLTGTVLAGVAGALLALPMAAAALMIIEELRVRLPGTTPLEEEKVEARDDARSEREYEQRTEHRPSTEAAAIAMEISEDRKDRERSSEKHTGPEKSS